MRALLAPAFVLVFGFPLFSIGISDWPVIGVTKANPVAVPVSKETPVVITSVITHPALITDSIKLEEFNSSGERVAKVGALQPVSGYAEHTYGITVRVYKEGPTELRYRVSAQFEGFPKPVYSELVCVFVQSKIAAKQALKDLASALELDFSGALKRFSLAAGSVETLKRLDRAQIKRLAHALRNARVITEEDSFALVKVPWVMENGTSSMRDMTLTRVATGEWFVLSW